MSLWKRTGAIFVALFLTLTLIAPQTARADATSEKSITDASAWIANRWETKRGQFFAAGTTADGIIALSAANREPNTVRSMLVDLKERGPNYTDFDGGYPAGLAKMIMTADIAGQNPRTLFGCERDLVAELLALVVERPKESREYWGPYLIAIALTRAGEQVPAWVIEDMEKNQDKVSGGFGYFENDGTFVGDPDYTSVGISAMDRVAHNPKNAADKQRVDANVEKAKQWSADAANQKSDAASNSYYWETYSSTNSTGMLASSLGEVGVEIESPVRYLTSQQKTDGGWAAAHNGKKSDVMATTQAILGVVGEGYGTARSTQVPEMVDCDTQTAPQFTTQPASTTVAPGADATFTVAVTGEPAPTIKWQQNDGGWWSDIKNATEATLILANVKGDSPPLEVRAVAVNLAGTRYSNVATLTVGTVVDPGVTPVFTTQPASTTVTAGDQAGFMVRATGNPAPTITWEEDVKGTWTPIQGAIGTVLTFDKLGIDSDGRQVRAVATNTAGATASNVATITVKPVVKPTPPVTPTPPVKPTPTYPATVYNTPGKQTVNGREWSTTCEKYSQTTRCFANIKATKVTLVGGKFVAKTDFVFNNLTYLPAPRKFWTDNKNPLGYEGQWTTTDGRKWKTDCNTPVTGNGCRSYIWARVVENVAGPGQPIRYAWVNKWEFNNMVQYS